MTVKDFRDLVLQAGEAGLQMTRLDAAEGSAGNLSVFSAGLRNLDGAFRNRGEIPLPVQAPGLAGGWVLVSGTGKRLRDIAEQPEESLCLLKIDPSGQKAELYSAGDVRPTSELNSHLAVHNSLVRRYGWASHAIVHGQPPYITFLSHIERYASTPQLNHYLLRWEPETILVFPHGIGMIPFQPPGSPEQMEATLAGLQKHLLVVWQRHGVVARSDAGLLKAADYVEYAETAARYEILNLLAGEPSAGLTEADLRRTCAAYQVEQTVFPDGGIRD